ncbi:MAG TPA: UDP-N-acetylmuramoyl-L-alanyl-D-glutamate--2,6-diaminopimelate ligase [Flavobacteriales bacterium]|nr:UDP-N-acetylmuramoyl-L-alanyl-D-glutamate--2,6-diaminopimelate ligase [Flavobacteriales bacterium]
MKILKDILYKTGIEDVIGSTNLAVEKITFDSREVEKFTLFVAVKGVNVDGHQFINKAIEQGAEAIVCEDLPAELNPKITYVKVQNSKRALGIIASNFYDNPSEKLTMVGVTGTNGKTTVATLLFNLFKAMGHKTGLLSTVENRIADKIIPSTHTTPDAIQLNSLLAKMVENGVSHCFMEVSSHAIDQDRIAGLVFDLGIFTNITHDHLDYHKTFNEYIKAKKKFFDNLSEEAKALINIDDKHGEVMVQNTKAKVYTYAMKTLADFHVKILENHFDGMLLSIDGQEVWTKLIGEFNAYNILAVYATTILLGEDEWQSLKSISQLKSAPGRFQTFETPNKIIVVVDYAHTPDALKNVLVTINRIRTQNESLITVVGCGGNRDQEKRPLMGAIAAQLSSKVLFTSDNPRYEDPDTIIEQMCEGVDPVDFKKTMSIPQRKEAIKVAYQLSQPGDVVLIAGKGHENYQEVKGEKHPFDDYKIAQEIFSKKP